MDRDSCDANGDCVLEAPEIFALADDEDVVTVKLAEPPDELYAAACLAAEACPVAAIRIEP